MGKELELAIKIGGRIDRSLGTAVNNAQKQLEAISKTANAIGSAVTAAVVTAGTALVTESVQTYADYQSALNSAAATAGVAKGTAEYEKMNEAAREAGRTTIKTAKEAANALEYMALAGWNVEDSTKALMPILKLSASTGADLATTSDLVTDSMANLGLGIDDLNHYLDVSATANNKSNQTAMQLQEAYLGVGGVLRTLNVPIEESAAILGVLANRGTKASEAGTALSAILVNMQGISPKSQAAQAMKDIGVSMFDAEGKTRNLMEVFQDVAKVTSNMSEKGRNFIYGMIGGKSHIDSFAKIMAGFNDTTADGTKEIYSLIEAFNNCDGALDNLYDIKTDTLAANFETLKSAVSDMQISIGEELDSMLNGAVKHITEKIPQIQKIIIKTLDKIIPIVERVFDYVIENSDKIIDALIKITAAFAGIKIGMGVIKGFNSIFSLVKNISAVAKVAGITKTLGGVAGALTGLSGAALPIAGVTAAVVALGFAAKAAYDHHVNYARGMNAQADAIGKTAGELTKINGLIKETKDLELIINNPESTQYQIDEAKKRLEEIAGLVGQEYNLTVNADTSSLDDALGKIQSLTRIDLINESEDLIKDISKNGTTYAKDIEKLPGLQDQEKALNAQYEAYRRLSSDFRLIETNYNTGKISESDYLSKMNELYSRAQESVNFDTTLIGDKITTGNADEFLRRLNLSAVEAKGNWEEVKEQLKLVVDNINEFDESANKAGEYLTQALLSDIELGDYFGENSDMSMLESLGEALIAAGKNTDELASKTALAQNGFKDFNSALESGAVAAVAQDFFEFKMSIGATAEGAALGAAAIQNGFETIEAAAGAGGEAVNNVLTDLMKLGEQNGVFDGVPLDEYASKLTSIAQQMGLIPEHRTVHIDAEGNISVIAEQLEEVGNISVQIDAEGGLAVLNTVTNEIQTLQGIGAVAMQINADGDIEVLDKAHDVIMTIDGESANISVDGKFPGRDVIETAMAAAKELDGETISAEETVVGKFDGHELIAKAIDFSEKLFDVDTWQRVNAVFSNEDQNKIATAIEYQGKLKDKDVTYTVNVVQNGTLPVHSASGASYFKGGLTYLNDQNISDPREIVEYGGKRWFYEGRNILADIPRGARIYNALDSRGAIAEAEAIINGSHKNGLSYVPFDGYIAELHKGEQVLTSDEAEEYKKKGVLIQAIERLRETFGDRKSKSNEENDTSEKRIIFAPTYQIYGSANKEEVREGSKLSYKDFKNFYEKMKRDEKRKAF